MCEAGRRYAREIRMRAARRGGELLKVMAENGERARSGGSLRKDSAAPILSDLGVTPDQSSRWQRIAAIPEERFA
jgi:hypothetical protein